jgi:hypothetical protein
LRAVAAGVAWPWATSTALASSQQMPTDCRSGLSAAIGDGRWTVSVSERAPVQFSSHSSLAVWDDVRCQHAVPAGTTRPVTWQPLPASGPPMLATRLDVAGSTSWKPAAK